MGISVDMFVKSFKANSKAKDKTFEEFINKHITTRYVPFITKSTICESIVKSCCNIKDGNHEIVKINSSNRYLFFTMKLIELYTDIEINITEENNLAVIYDKLAEIGAANVLLSAIPEDEYIEFSTILNMKMDDFRENEYSLTALLYNLKQSLSLSDEIITDVINSPEIKALIEETKTE